MKALYAVMVVAVIAGCASVKPAPVQVGDRCIRCRRVIGDLKVAGEIVDQLKTPLPFRTAGCLAKYVKGHPGEPLTAVFVTDYQTGRMLEAEDAWFVPTRMQQPDTKKAEDDYLAFRSRDAAAASTTEKPVLLRWNQVLAAASAE
jgi:hypothetical protein